MEDTCMSAGFKAMHDHIPGDQVEFPPSEEGMKASKSYSGESLTFSPLTKPPNLGGGATYPSYPVLNLSIVVYN